jgi:hypothetical protein
MILNDHLIYYYCFIINLIDNFLIVKTFVIMEYRPDRYHNYYPTLEDL